MTKKIKADGETWNVQLSEEPAHAGVRSIVFHCSSNTSWGWRITELPTADAERLEEGGGIDGLAEEDLQRLFERSQPFDYTHDPKSLGHRGGPPG